ncbi:uncharacterized protein LOC126212727 [Schistocerca nitens]|uniref:uncharacterized protein LOC126212727 n=1 Tax=Schistocerca nitens TaxID=7011 RepID=UPI002118E593|nr:uncharacterized protein LOC126212727 [Schistocerca nitens]
MWQTYAENERIIFCHVCVLAAGRSENKKENGCGQGERRRASCGFAQPAERLPVRSSLYWDCSACDARCVCRHVSQPRQPTTRPAGVAASPLALLASNGASVLDCVCSHVGRRGRPRGEGERGVFLQLSAQGSHWTLQDLDTPCIAVPVVARLAQSSWRHGPPWPAEGDKQPRDEEGRGGAPVAVRGIIWTSGRGLSGGLACLVAADCTNPCSVHGCGRRASRRSPAWRPRSMPAEPAATQLRPLDASSAVEAD